MLPLCYFLFFIYWIVLSSFIFFPSIFVHLIPLLSEKMTLLNACGLLHAWVHADMQIYRLTDTSVASRKFICVSDGFYKVSLLQLWSQRCRERGKWLSKDDMFRNIRELKNLQSLTDNRSFQYVVLKWFSFRCS